MPAVRVGSPVPRDVAAARVLDDHGHEVALGSFWSKGPCLVVLLRHFGCVGCAEQVTELRPRLDELARVGVRTVLVGNGSRQQMTDFVDRHALAGCRVEVTTDPGLGVYEAMGLRRSRWATIGPRALVDLARAMAAGHPHRPVEGDATQQGGVLLVDAQGVVRLRHANRSIGDHSPTSDLVEAALRLAIEARAAGPHV